MDLVVLAGSYLLPIVIWIFVIIKILQNKRQFRIIRVIKTIILFTAVYHLIFSWDTYLGRYKLSKLCEESAGLVVYKTVELAPDYWGRDGHPLFHDKRNGEFLPEVLDNRFSSETQSSSLPPNKRIYKFTSLIKDNLSDEYLLSLTRYTYWGGWYSDLLDPYGPGGEYGCDLELGERQIDGASFNHKIWSHVLIPSSDINVGISK